METEDMKRLLELSKLEVLNMEGCDHGWYYYGVKNSQASEETMGLINEVEGILKEYIGGFASFANFTTSNGVKKLRYMLNYNHGISERTFIGVDYIPLSDLVTFKKLTGESL